MTVILDKTKVGDSAQTTAALGADVKVSKDFKVGANCNFFGRLYADWTFSASDILPNATKVYETPWRVPSAWTLDLDARYTFNIGNVKATLSGNILMCWIRSILLMLLMVQTMTGKQLMAYSTDLDAVQR